MIGEIHFFLTTRDYVIGTPGGMTSSPRTVDVTFNDLAKNYDLQSKLRLASAALIKPAWLPPLAYPMQGQELIEHTATYLASFSDNTVERRERRNYLLNNGLVRILVTD